MTTLYQAFGYSVFEGEIDSVVQKRIVFAIALANKPAWLSWYVYVEGLHTWERSKFELITRTDIPNNQGWDKVNFFGSMLAGGAAAAFKLQDYINVNQFSGFQKSVSGVADGSAVIWRKDENINAIVRIEIDPPVSKSVQFADFVVKFKRQGDMLNDMAVRRAGKVWLLGSVKYTASAVADGPVSSAKAGNFSAFDRGM